MAIELRIYNEFSQEILIEWQNLFLSLGGNYNLSPEWCNIWFKYFGGKNKKPYIVTLWQNNRLKLLAPFYQKGNRIYLIGSRPDFYDEFCILTSGIEYTNLLVQEIFKQKFHFDFRLISSECCFTKLFLRRLESESNISKKIYYYTLKPVTRSNLAFSNNFSQKINRKIRRCEKKYGQTLKFDFEVDKNSGYIDELLSFHKKKWSLFNCEKVEAFVKDLYFNTDLLVLSRLAFQEDDRFIASQLAYKTDNRLSISMSSYDKAYSDASPSLILHYKFFLKAFKNGINTIDFGAGGQPYKYHFTNAESIILSVKTDLSWKKKHLLYQPLKNLKARCAGFFI